MYTIAKQDFMESLVVRKEEQTFFLNRGDPSASDKQRACDVFPIPSNSSALNSSYHSYRPKCT